MHLTHFLLIDQERGSGWPCLGGCCFPRSLTDGPGAEFSLPGSSTGPHEGPRPFIPQGSLQIDGMHQCHAEERGVHVVGDGKAVCMWVPQAPAGDHHAVLPLAPDADRAHQPVVGRGDSLDQVLDLSTQHSGQVGTQGRMVGHTGQLVGQVSLHQLLRPDPEELHLRPGRPQEDMERGEEGGDGGESLQQGIQNWGLKPVCWT